MSEKRVNKDFLFTVDCVLRNVHVKTCIAHFAYSLHTLHTDSNQLFHTITRKGIENPLKRREKKEKEEKEEEKLWNEWMDICMERYNAEKPTNIHLLLLSKVVLNRIGFGGDEV